MSDEGGGGGERRPAADKPGVLVRCKGPACPVRGGQILFRMHAGLTFIDIGVRDGERLDAIVLMAYIWRCHACGFPWINPQVVAADGLAAQMQQAMTDAAAHANGDQPPPKRRARPRRATAA